MGRKYTHTPCILCFEQVQDLLKGESDADGGKGGRALAVQDVNAPAEYVWDRILDFGNYKKMARKVQKTVGAASSQYSICSSRACVDIARSISCGKC